jgi:hypothetical protein
MVLRHSNVFSTLKEKILDSDQFQIFKFRFAIENRIGVVGAFSSLKSVNLVRSESENIRVQLSLLTSLFHQEDPYS